MKVKVADRTTCHVPRAGTLSPASSRRQSNVDSLLLHHLRRRPGINSTLGESLVFADTASQSKVTGGQTSPSMHLRRWPSIETTLFRRKVFTGNVISSPVTQDHVPASPQK